MLELLKNRGLGRNEVWLAQAVANFIDGQCAVFQMMQGFANVEYAQNIVQLAIVHRQFIVIAGDELMAQRVNVVVDIERLDFRARRHQVVDLDFFQIKQIDQNALMLFRHQRRLFQHQSADFLTRENFLIRFRIDTHQTQQTVGKQIGEPHRWIDDGQQWLENQTGG